VEQTPAAFFCIHTPTSFSHSATPAVHDGDNEQKRRIDGVSEMKMLENAKNLQKLNA
jgi:hypothetical protein